MKKRKSPALEEPSVKEVCGSPENAFDMLNKFGTYNIQPTADADNEFPAIAQGFSKKNKGE